LDPVTAPAVRGARCTVCLQAGPLDALSPPVCCNCMTAAQLEPAASARF